MCSCSYGIGLTRLLFYVLITDGSSPSDVTESASSSSSSTTVTPNGVVPTLRLSPVVGIAASLLVTVSSALVVLA